MTRYKILILVVASCLFAQHSFSQRSKKVERAIKTYEAGEYKEALDLLKEAYDFESDKDKKNDILFKLGDCCRRLNDPSKAEMWFKKVIDKNYQDPVAYIYYADALKMNGKYPEALDVYKKYKELVPDDSRGTNGIESCELAKKWMDSPSGYEVENMKDLNTKAMDFCPAYSNTDYSEIYFTSSREGTTGKTINKITGQPYTDIFFSKEDRKGKWNTPQIVPEINSEFDDGCPSFTPDYNTMYYCLCKNSKKKQYGCQIIVSNRSGEAWGKGKVIPIAGDSITIAHPAISPDELTLYFVSDKDGGIGGKDIWQATRKTKTDEFGTAENLGDAINTPGNEMFPYVHPDGTLYFSSDGHTGIGGLDIFKAKKDSKGKWTVENLKTPINSPYDDFGIVFQKNVEAGLFSSTRNGKDDDIFAFVLPPLKFNITGIVKNENNDSIIIGAAVKAIGSDGSTMDNTTGKEGAFKFMLKPGTDYVFIVSKIGFLNGKERETTKGIAQSKDFKTIIYLTSTSKPIELPNIFYDFNKWDLRPESMVSLDKLVETLNDNPNITIELMSHTDCRGNDKDNEILSQKRAQSVVNYLIEKGIDQERLTAKGYGESTPKTVDNKIAAQYPFLKPNDVLTEDYISKLKSVEDQETAHQINRRTEFKVLRNDYIPKKK
jgi:peptidoglycan-associated lipoprotein